uniref:Uncharacterized protein n=1 Tax=Parascaris univalens TaxID=6257 RepID=A0A915A4M2_PARUN
MKFNPRSKVSVGSPSRERRDRDKKDRQTSTSGRSTPPRRENEEDRRIRKRRWEDHVDEDRQAARTVDRARPLRDTVSPGGRPPDPIRPVDQPGTLRQRIERIACLNDTEVSHLSENDLRSLTARLLELSREQERLFKGRRTQIETLQEMFRSARDDVERLAKSLPSHLRVDLPPLPSLHPAFQNEPTPAATGTPLLAQVNGGVCVAASGPAPAMPSVFGPPQPGVSVPVSVMSAVSNGSSGPASSGVVGSGVPLNAHQQPPITFSGVNGPSTQIPQEFAPPVSQPSSSVAPSFPVAPSLLNRPPAYGMAAPMSSTNTNASLPPFMRMPPPTTAAPGHHPPRYGTPVRSTSPFGRPPPGETASSSSSLPNLSQPPPPIVTPVSGNVPPPDFSMPPPPSLSSTSESLVCTSANTSIMSLPKSSTHSDASSSSLTASASANSTAVDSDSSSASAALSANLPRVNLSVPPPAFPLPPLRVDPAVPPSYSGPPFVPITALPPPTVPRAPIPHGLPTSMMLGITPNIGSAPPPSMNMTIPPMSGPPNLSCPPPNMTCPPPNVRPPVNLGNPQNVHQMMSAIVSRSATSGQTPVEVVTELLASAYTRGSGFGSVVASGSTGPPPRMSVPPPGLGPPISGPPPNVGGPPPVDGTNKLPTVNLSTVSLTRGMGSGNFRGFGGPSIAQGRFSNRAQQQSQASQHQRRQISDMVAIIPDENDLPESRDHQEDSNIFLIVSDEEDN